VAASALNDAASEVFVSDVTIWEITSKHSNGRLPLPDSPRLWIPQKTSYHQLQQVPLTYAAIYRSGELPRVHADPFDRLLAAQAIEESLVILSPDVQLSSLGSARIW